jgi:ribulose 1,5-bisphosphate carboxylase large subunit-like protein
MERKECDENYVSVKVCQERHLQIHNAHEAKHNDVLDKLRSHSDILKDVDKEVTESFKRVHDRIDEFLNRVTDNSTEITALVNQEVINLMERINQMQDKMKSMVIYLLISILLSIFGAGMSFVMSKPGNADVERNNTALVHEIRAINEKIDALDRRLSNFNQGKGR